MGRCLEKWAWVETNLALLMMGLMRHRRGNLVGAAFHSAVSFRAKLKMVDAIAQQTLAGKWLQNWDKLRDRIRRRSEKRNQIAHFHLMGHGKPTAPLEMRLHPYRSITRNLPAPRMKVRRRSNYTSVLICSPSFRLRFWSFVSPFQSDCDRRPKALHQHLSRLPSRQTIAEFDLSSRRWSVAAGAHGEAATGITDRAAASLDAGIGTSIPALKRKRGLVGKKCLYARERKLTPITPAMIEIRSRRVSTTAAERRFIVPR